MSTKACEKTSLKHKGVYIHIPFCVSRCYYCSFYSQTNLTLKKNYITALENEIARCGKGDSINSIYIGGGTPSLLSVEELLRINKAIKEKFFVCKNTEFTVEVNPESAGKEFLEAASEIGVNRLSVGLQTHENDILKKIGRQHTILDFYKVIENSKINNINVDFIIGLPNQTTASVIESLETVAALDKIKHMSIYALSVEKGTRLQRRGYTPDDSVAGTYHECVSFLEKIGYYRYEISNLAKKGFESIHNKKYWSLSEYYGFGAGATSFLDNCFIKNPNLENYLTEKAPKRELLTKGQYIKDIIMLSLRTTEGLNTKSLLRKANYDILKEKEKEIAFLQKNRLLEINRGHIKITKNSFYLQNAIVLKLI